jgi:eukaryotic-like serine/threonine-protein kinase
MTMPPESVETVTERELSRYRVEQRLARTKAAVVFRAFDRERECRVILKVDRGHHQRTHSALREGTLLMPIRHVALPRVYDAGSLADGRTYVTLELVDGESLHTLMARGPIPLSSALVIVRRVAGALAHLHEAGYLHRDVKPQNIVVPIQDDQPCYDRCVLLDLGIALPLTNASSWGDICGTLQYMPPEQFTGTRQTVESDVFALGATLYELLFGTRVRGVDDIVSARAADGRGPRVFMGPGVVKCVTCDIPMPETPRYDPALLDCLSRMLRRVASERPHSMSEVLERLTVAASD